MIEVTDLVKRYGKNEAVDRLNFHVKKGQIYGFLGPNGAGKTTTMNMLTGYIAPTSGRVVINGHDISEEPMEARRCIGYLPEQPPLYQDMTPLEYLNFVADLKGIEKAGRAAEIERVMQRTRIVEMENRLIRNLSKGYRQRVGLAQAILGDPEILILDEPMVGLDPKQIIEIRELIKSFGKKHTVILSSHILSEITSICDHIMIISHGKLVASDTPERLSSRMTSSGTMELTVRGSKEDCERAMKLLEKIKGLEVKATTATLEDVFLELTSDEKDEEPAEDGTENEDEENESEAENAAEPDGGEGPLLEAVSEKPEDAEEVE